MQAVLFKQFLQLRLETELQSWHYNVEELPKYCESQIARQVLFLTIDKKVPFKQDVQFVFDKTQVLQGGEQVLQVFPSITSGSGQLLEQVWL